MGVLARKALLFGVWNLGTLDVLSLHSRFGSGSWFWVVGSGFRHLALAWGLASSRCWGRSSIDDVADSVVVLVVASTVPCHIPSDGCEIFPRAPSIYILPTFGPKVYRYDLLWAIWSPRAQGRYKRASGLPFKAYNL